MRYCIRVWTGVFSWEPGEWKFLHALHVLNEQGTSGVLQHELTERPELALTSNSLEVMQKVAELVPARSWVEEFEAVCGWLKVRESQKGKNLDVRG